MTVREVLAEGGAALAAAGVENPGLDVSLLLAEVLNASRSSLIAAACDPVAEESLADFYDFVNRRLAGECVAYILGRKEFYDLEFLVNPSVLVPRPETETLVETVLEQLEKRKEKREKNNSPVRVLDLCTGSGAVAVALKYEMPELEVWAADISEEALWTAKENAARLLPPDSIHFKQGDLFNSFSILNSQFSIIVSNPPYIPGAEIAGLSPEVRNEPVLALDGGSDGLEIIKRIIAGAPEFLCAGGFLLLEADPRQMERIAALFEKSGFTEIQTYRDLSGEERVIGGCCESLPPR